MGTLRDKFKAVLALFKPSATQLDLPFEKVQAPKENESLASDLGNSIHSAQKKNIVLEHGSLLIMRGTTQHFWKHQIPKTSKAVGLRINLTFRVIK